jgi:hypothetical protein
MIRNKHPGSYFQELASNFWVKILKFFVADPESGRIRSAKLVKIKTETQRQWKRYGTIYSTGKVLFVLYLLTVCLFMSDLLLNFRPNIHGAFCFEPFFVS